MKTIVAFIAILMLASCGNSAVEKPKKLIDENVMIDIFYDLALLDAIKSQKPLALNVNNVNPDKYIYNKYKIDSLQFAQSNRFYASDIKKYKKMYAEVSKRFQANVSKMDSTHVKNLKKKDAAAKPLPSIGTPVVN